jgi:hypothetical protein
MIEIQKLTKIEGGEVFDFEMGDEGSTTKRRTPVFSDDDSSRDDIHFWAEKVRGSDWLSFRSRTLHL